MAIVITGSEGNIGKRLMRAFPGAIGVDVKPGAAVVADLATAEFGRGRLWAAFAGAEAVIHLAASADPAAAAAVHLQSVIVAARLFAACAELKVPRIVAASSDWADPKFAGSNAYGRSKRILEEMAAIYSGVPGQTAVALRVGWVPADVGEVVDAPDWLALNYWDDARLIAEVRTALGN